MKRDFSFGGLEEGDFLIEKQSSKAYKIINVYPKMIGIERVSKLEEIEWYTYDTAKHLFKIIASPCDLNLAERLYNEIRSDEKDGNEDRDRFVDALAYTFGARTYSFSTATDDFIKQTKRLMPLIEDKLDYDPKNWIPKNGERYFTIYFSDNSIMSFPWINDDSDNGFRRNVGIYKTANDAKVMMNRLLHEIDNVIAKNSTCI